MTTKEQKVDFFSSRFCRRLLSDRFALPLNYPEQNSSDSESLLSDLSESEIKLDIAEENIKAALEQAGGADINKAEDSKYIYKIWLLGCSLGYRYKGATHDIDIWTRRMVRGAGEEIRPWLGAIWRLLEHDATVQKPVFDTVFSLRNKEPGITAGQVYKYVEEKLNNERDISRYKNNVNAIFAALEEYENPSFITERIDAVLKMREHLCPRCHLKFFEDEDTCSYCGAKLELANRYVCLKCEKYVSDEFAYCPHCGTKINRTPEINDELDTLRFSIQKFTYDYDAEPSDVVAIYINDHNFKKIIRDCEWENALKTGDYDSSGLYVWLTVDDIIENLGKVAVPDKENDSETLILGCSSGCAEEWPLYVTITEVDDQVIWSGFRNSFKTDPESSSHWDYSGLGEYRFDKKQYFSEIDKLKRWRLIKDRRENNNNPMFIPSFWAAGCQLGLVYIERGIDKLTDWTRAQYKAVQGKNAEKLKYWIPAFWKTVQELLWCRQYLERQGKRLDTEVMKKAFETIGTVQKLELNMRQYDYFQNWEKHIEDKELIQEYEPYIRAAFDGMEEYTHPTKITFTVNNEIDLLKQNQVFEQVLSQTFEETDEDEDYDYCGNPVDEDYDEKG